MGYIDSFNDLLLFSYDFFLNIFWLMFYADLVVRVSSGFPICGPMHVSCIFFFFFIYFNSYNRGGGIWTLDVSVGNTKRCQMSYKALGSSMYIYDDLIDNMQSVWQWTNCNAICGLRGLDSNLVLWHLNILANWAFSGKLYALPTAELQLQKLITVTHLKLLNH